MRRVAEVRHGSGLLVAPALLRILPQERYAGLIDQLVHSEDLLVELRLQLPLEDDGGLQVVVVRLGANPRLFLGRETDHRMGPRHAGSSQDNRVGRRTVNKPEARRVDVGVVADLLCESNVRARIRVDQDYVTGLDVENASDKDPDRLQDVRVRPREGEHEVAHGLEVVVVFMVERPEAQTALALTDGCPPSVQRIVLQLDFVDRRLQDSLRASFCSGLVTEACSVLPQQTSDTGFYAGHLDRLTQPSLQLVHGGPERRVNAQAVAERARERGGRLVHIPERVGNRAGAGQSLPWRLRRVPVLDRRVLQRVFRILVVLRQHEDARGRLVNDVVFAWVDDDIRVLGDPDHDAVPV
mmetsp:Transcript_64253/g.177778  ORF Transcript_64253/g.177778 Transcript_64253/m.177778 type:complete len:354 (+) Transcript_64253:585-1646(+)